MASIGRLLPPAIARRLWESRLKPATVLFLDIRFPRTGEVKRKFSVVLTSSEETLLFVINTRPSRLVERNPELAACQVRIDVASHPFLTLFRSLRPVGNEPPIRSPGAVHRIE